MTSNFPWKESFLVAILETDDRKLPDRIRTARASIEGRLAELQSHDGALSGERLDLEDSLESLAKLLEERIGVPGVICRICLQSVSLEDCKLDDNEKIVHERCYIRELLASASAAEHNSQKKP